MIISDEEIRKRSIDIINRARIDEGSPMVRLAINELRIMIHDALVWARSTPSDISDVNFDEVEKIGNEESLTLKKWYFVLKEEEYSFFEFIGHNLEDVFEYFKKEEETEFEDGIHDAMFECQYDLLVDTEEGVREYIKANPIFNDLPADTKIRLGDTEVKDGSDRHKNNLSKMRRLYHHDG